MILILDHIRSAHNVGALFRTADGAGMEEVYLVGYTPEPAREGKLHLTLAEKTLRKTALGAEYALPWKKVASLRRLTTRLKKAGFIIVMLEQGEKSLDYRHWKPPKGKKIALVVGNEVDGIVPQSLDSADIIIELPMRGSKNSLNVSVAAGIALYHLSATMEKPVKS